jgi:menaquinol-cytochrome c reductase iron-sulfur subunit
VNLEPSREHTHAPDPRLWPVGFAVGVVLMVAGIYLTWPIVILGAIVSVVFASLWVRAAAASRELTTTPAVVAEKREEVKAQRAAIAAHSETKYVSRSKFLETSTLGLAGVIGGLINVPILGFMIGPAFLKQGVPDHDIGPFAKFPQGQFVITTFTSQPKEGDVSRRTAFVRYNGELGNQPSFTIISNHCAHLGCPVQPNGPPVGNPSTYQDVTWQGVQPSGFGCPCHGGQYDIEGNRIAGPPVRSLDRYSFSIRNGHVFVGAPFSVSHVDGTGATAKIHKYTYSFPGEHVHGIESWLYPIQPPH